MEETLQDAGFKVRKLVGEGSHRIKVCGSLKICNLSISVCYKVFSTELPQIIQPITNSQ